MSNEQSLWLTQLMVQKQKSWAWAIWAMVDAVKYRLSNSIAARVYCLSFIGERALDTVAGDRSLWPELREYFNPERRKRFAGLLAELPRPACSEGRPFPQKGDMYHLWLQISAALRSCPKEFKFDDTEIAYIRRVFENFGQLINQREAQLEAICHTRRELDKCQWTIARKWFQIEAWNRLRNVEEFYRNPVLGEPTSIESAIADFTANS